MKVIVEKTIKYSGINFDVSANVVKHSDPETWEIEDIDVWIDDHDVYDVLGLSVIDYLESEIKELAKLEVS